MIEHTKKYKQHVSTTTAAFGFYTLIFCFFKIAIDIYSIHKDSPRYGGVVLIVAFSLIFSIFMYSRNLTATKNELICGNADHTIAASATIIPFFVIYTLGVLALQVFPGWKRCFSNTFGTGFATTFLNLNDTMTNWIKTYTPEGNNQSSTNTNLDTLNYMLETNPETLFNELIDDQTIGDDNGITWKSFDVIDRMLKVKFNIQPVNDEILNENLHPSEDINHLNSIKKELLTCVSIRDTIGLCIWLYGLGLITLQVGFNAILSQDCSSFKRSHEDVQEYIKERLKA
jgi:hypothetical protein